MSVVSVQEDFDGRQGDIALEGVRNYTRVFNVRTNSVSDSGATIFNATGVPILWSVHPDDSWAKVIKKSARQGEDANWWQVTVDYSTKLPIDPDEAAESPLARPPKVRIGTNKFSRIITEDVNGDAIVNSAGQPFEGGYEVSDSRATLSISWNVSAASFNYITLTDLQNKINSDTYLGYSAGKLLVTDVSADGPTLENDVLFWACSVSLEIKNDEDGWAVTKVLDQGYMQLGDGGEPELIRDASGQPVTQMKLLDGVGTELPNGGTPVFLEFAMYDAATFGDVLP